MLILVMSIAPALLAMPEVVDAIAMLPMEGAMRVVGPWRAWRSLWPGRAATTHQAKTRQGGRD